MVECGGLENRLRVIPVRGFESLLLRHCFSLQRVRWARFFIDFGMIHDIENHGGRFIGVCSILQAASRQRGPVAPWEFLRVA